MHNILVYWGKPGWRNPGSVHEPEVQIGTFNLAAHVGFVVKEFMPAFPTQLYHLHCCLVLPGRGKISNAQEPYVLISALDDIKAPLCSRKRRKGAPVGSPL